MRSHEDIQELQQKQICFKCVADAVLSREIETNGSAGTCSFCSDDDPCYDLETMSDRVATAFEQHYNRTSDQPTSMQYAMLKDKESDYEGCAPYLSAQWHSKPTLLSLESACSLHRS